jgi:hypothetical protein
VVDGPQCYKGYQPAQQLRCDMDHLYRPSFNDCAFTAVPSFTGPFCAKGEDRDILQAMSRRFFHAAASFVLIIAALTPLMECFDYWDKNPGPASDTEIHLTAWFVGAGIVLTLAKLLKYVPRFVSSGKDSHPGLPNVQLAWQWTDRTLTPTASPPLTPLRI